jgi:hypothetical protein
MSEMRPVTDKEVRDDAAGVEAGYELGVRWASVASSAAFVWRRRSAASSLTYVFSSS